MVCNLMLSRCADEFMNRSSSASHFASSTTAHVSVLRILSHFTNRALVWEEEEEEEEERCTINLSSNR